MSPYYSIFAELKTWEPRFEPLLDPSQWPMYDGMDYVLNMAMRKIQKGRCKKTWLHNEMDDMEKSYETAMYGSGDFDQIKKKVHCFLYHSERHCNNLCYGNPNQSH
jgi:hypothetical protein